MDRAIIINVADLVNPNDPEGRTYRQINAAKKHAIPIGALVEDIDTGVRLFVVKHGRDCDMTPLYYLSANRDDTEQKDPRFLNRGWVGGYSETYLRIVKKS